MIRNATTCIANGPKVLNSCADSLTAPLHHLFSLSLANGVIPSDWKCHNIIGGDYSTERNDGLNHGTERFLKLKLATYHR